MKKKDMGNSLSALKGQKGVPGRISRGIVNEIKKKNFLYILVLPGLLYYIIFRYIPMYGIIISFKDFKIGRGIWGSEWIGLEHFKRLFGDPTFYQLLRNTIFLSIVTLIFGFTASLILALMLNELRSKAYLRVTQNFLYIPHFISWAILGTIVIQMLSPSTGIINIILSRILGIEPIYFMKELGWWVFSFVMVDLWHGVGWGTILYMAAMAQINPELYESAIIDGAGRLKRMWHITLPGIKGTVAVLLILSMGGVLRMGLEKILILQNDLVLEVSDVFETYIFRMGIRGGQYSYTTAIGFFQSVVGLLFIITSNKIVKKLGEGGLW